MSYNTSANRRQSSILDSLSESKSKTDGYSCSVFKKISSKREANNCIYNQSNNQPRSSSNTTTYYRQGQSNAYRNSNEYSNQVGSSWYNQDVPSKPSGWKPLKTEYEDELLEDPFLQAQVRDKADPVFKMYDSEGQLSRTTSPERDENICKQCSTINPEYLEQKIKKLEELIKQNIQVPKTPASAPVKPHNDVTNETGVISSEETKIKQCIESKNKILPFLWENDKRSFYEADTLFKIMCEDDASTKVCSTCYKRIKMLYEAQIYGWSEICKKAGNLNSLFDIDPRRIPHEKRGFESNNSCMTAGRTRECKRQGQTSSWKK